MKLNPAIYFKIDRRIFLSIEVIFKQIKAVFKSPFIRLQ